MSLSAQSRGVKVAFVIVSATLFALGSFVILGVPEASAGTNPAIVCGYVKDSAGRPIDEVDLVIEIWDPTNTTMRASKIDNTNPAGYYSTTQFSTSEWYAGDWVKVVADYNGDQEENGTWAVEKILPNSQWVNITYPYEIPEFGSTLGLIIAGVALGVMAVVVVVYFRRK